MPIREPRPRPLPAETHHRQRRSRLRPDFCVSGSHSPFQTLSQSTSGNQVFQFAQLKDKPPPSGHSLPSVARGSQGRVKKWRQLIFSPSRSRIRSLFSGRTAIRSSVHVPDILQATASVLLTRIRLYQGSRHIVGSVLNGERTESDGIVFAKDIESPHTVIIRQTDLGMNNGLLCSLYCAVQAGKPSSYRSGARKSIPGAAQCQISIRWANGPADGYSPGFRPRLFMAALTKSGTLWIERATCAIRST